MLEKLPTTAAKLVTRLRSTRASAPRREAGSAHSPSFCLCTIADTIAELLLAQPTHKAAVLALLDPLEQRRLEEALGRVSALQTMTILRLLAISHSNVPEQAHAQTLRHKLAHLVRKDLSREVTTAYGGHTFRHPVGFALEQRQAASQHAELVAASLPMIRDDSALPSVAAFLLACLRFLCRSPIAVHLTQRWSSPGRQEQDTADLLEKLKTQLQKLREQRKHGVEISPESAVKAALITVRYPKTKNLFSKADQQVRRRASKT